MSKNRRYIEQFDSHAGMPADFDSLFKSENGRIIAKRRIRMKSRKSRVVQLSAAAAAIICAAAAGLSSLDIQNNDTGISISELAQVTESDTAAFTEYVDNANQPVTTAEAFPLTDTFDYSIYREADINEENAVYSLSESAFANANFITYANVVSKQYTDDNSVIEYTLCTKEFFVPKEFENPPEELPMTFTLSVPVSHLPDSFGELQTGSEYILPLNITRLEYDTYSFELADNIFPIRKTENGWLMSDTYSTLCGSSEHTSYDMGDGEFEIAYISCTDEQMSERLVSVFDRTKPYVHYSLPADEGTVMNAAEVFAEGLFENISVSPFDSSVLILENKEYFQLIPNISGTVIYAGRSADGQNMAVISPDSGFAAVMFTGMSELAVSQGDYVTDGTEIGSCSYDAVYCRFIDHSGNKVLFED